MNALAALFVLVLTLILAANGTGNEDFRRTRRLVKPGNKISFHNHHLLKKTNNANPVFHGGSLISNVQVITVLWGGDLSLFPSYLTGTSTPNINTFYQQVTNSSFLDWISEEYSTSLQLIGRGIFLTQVKITPPSSSSTIDDTTLQTDLQSLIMNRKLPPPLLDQNGNTVTLYSIHVPTTISITLAGAGSSASGVGVSCVDFCGYHNGFTMGSTTVIYSVLPDVSSGGCVQGCGSGTAWQNQQSVASHELIEAITNPNGGGWYDDQTGNEVADICQTQPDGTFVGTDGVTYTIQPIYSRSLGTCRSSETATNDFNVAISQFNSSVSIGGAVSFTVLTTVTNGNPLSLNLAVLFIPQQPAGVSISLTSSVTAGSTATLTFSTASQAVTGTFTFVVIAKASPQGPTHSASGLVTILPASADFALSISSVGNGGLNLSAGRSVSLQVQTLITHGRPSQSIVLSLIGLPAPIIATFNPSTVQGGASSLLNLTAGSSLGGGVISLTVQGEGIITHTNASVTIFINLLGPDFSLSISPTSGQVHAGSSLTYNISSFLKTGNAQTIALSVGGLPSGVTASFSPSIVTGQSTTLTLSARNQAPTSNSTFTVTGTVATASTVHTISASLSVLGIDFSLSVVQIGPIVLGLPVIFNVSTVPIGNGSSAQKVNFTISGKGFVGTFSPASILVGSISILNLTVNSNVTVVTFTITATGNISGSHTVSSSFILPTLYGGLQNGDFATSDISPWIPTGVVSLVYGITPQVTSGLYSVMLGDYFPSGDSSISQTFILPPNVRHLSFWFVMSCPDIIPLAYTSVTLADLTKGTVYTILPETCEPDTYWRHVVFPLNGTLATGGVSLANDLVNLTLKNHDDGGFWNPTFTLYNTVAVA